MFFFSVDGSFSYVLVHIFSSYAFLAVVFGCRITALPAVILFVGLKQMDVILDKLLLCFMTLIVAPS